MAPSSCRTSVVFQAGAVASHSHTFHLSRHENSWSVRDYWKCKTKGKDGCCFKRRAKPSCRWLALWYGSPNWTCLGLSLATCYSRGQTQNRLHWQWMVCVRLRHWLQTAVMHFPYLRGWLTWWTPPLYIVRPAFYNKGRLITRLPSLPTPQGTMTAGSSGIDLRTIRSLRVVVTECLTDTKRNDKIPQKDNIQNSESCSVHHWRDVGKMLNPGQWVSRIGCPHFWCYGSGHTNWALADSWRDRVMCLLGPSSLERVECFSISL